jgi:ABC-2 type transport system ATP-binding protein
VQPTFADPAPAMLSHVHKRHGGLAALEDVDLSLQPGRVLALLGPNGAGKSTAVALLLGVQRADAGQVLLFGQSPQRLEARRRVGVMLQSAALPETLSVGELIAQTRGYYADPLGVADCVAIAGLDGLLPAATIACLALAQRRLQRA